MNSMLRTTGLMLLAAGFVGAQGWHIDVVDPTGIGRFSSLKIDKDGNAHVAYVIDDGNKFPLRYGFWDHTVRRWFLMNVAEGASFCALVLDSKQRPHISWADNGTVPGT